MRKLITIIIITICILLPAGVLADKPAPQPYPAPGAEPMDEAYPGPEPMPEPYVFPTQPGEGCSLAEGVACVWGLFPDIQPPELAFDWWVSVDLQWIEAEPFAAICIYRGHPVHSTCMGVLFYRAEVVQSSPVVIYRNWYHTNSDWIICGDQYVGTSFFNYTPAEVRSPNSYFINCLHGPTFHG